LDLFSDIKVSATEVLILNFGEEETKYALGILNTLRSLGIRSELYPDNLKLKKQMSYANSKKISYIIIAGEDEIKDNNVIIKVMSSGEQKKMPLTEIVSFLKTCSFS